MAPYQAEIDASLSPDERKIRAKASKTYATAGFAYPVLVRPYMTPWRRQTWPIEHRVLSRRKALRLENFRLSVMEIAGKASLLA
jgi:hypothetical protein